MRKKIQNIAKSLKGLIPDVLAIGGVVCISYGAYSFIKPLGYITLGCLLIGGAYIWSKSE